ncbi:MAG: hypothetical protein IPL31_04665 [Saprospiraceae bacterium]|nr:hypothetical protein [Saprospiraceae bacterium]
MYKIYFLFILFFGNNVLYAQSYDYNLNARQNEINAFSNFSEDDFGKNNINAYLLSYITWLMYPERLAKNLSDSNNSSAITQYSNLEFFSSF